MVKIGNALRSEIEKVALMGAHNLKKVFMAVDDKARTYKLDKPLLRFRNPGSYAEMATKELSHGNLGKAELEAREAVIQTQIGARLKQEDRKFYPRVSYNDLSDNLESQLSPYRLRSLSKTTKPRTTLGKFT